MFFLNVIHWYKETIVIQWYSRYGTESNVIKTNIVAYKFMQ